MREFTAVHGLPDDVVYKEVVVIGNGPSGICMSYQLAGHWAVLKEGAQTHPEPMLEARLQNAPSERPLPNQRLHDLAEGLEGRSQNPIPLLMDCLTHPGADTGMDLPSMVEWKYFPEKQIDHVVLGRGPVGGSWHDIDSGVVTLSPARWMTLPGKDRLPTLEPDQRAPVPTVAAYYESYVMQTSLQRFFRNNTFVTSVKPIKFLGKMNCSAVGCPATAAWCVCGYDSAKRESFRYVCSRVILATGASDRPNSLRKPDGNGVGGGAIRSPRGLQTALKTLGTDEHVVEATLPVLVIGSGLSAADAILRLRSQGLRVAHAYRGPSAALKALPPSLYPEYHQVHHMMKEGTSGNHQLYTALPDHILLEILQDGKPILGDDDEPELNYFATRTVKLLNTKNEHVIEMEVSLCIILIGSRPDLHFLPDDFDSDYLTWNVNGESLKSDVLSKVGRLDSQTFERNLDKQSKISKTLKYPTEMCIKCLYSKTNNVNVKEENRPNSYGRTCFLKTWHNFKCIVGQSLQMTRQENKSVNSEDSTLLEKTREEKSLNNNTYNTNKPSQINNPKLDSLSNTDFQGCGVGLGVHSDRPIDSRTNPIYIDKASHTVQNAPKGMYALGPLTGDNFVRFIPGGALAIVSHIWKEKKAEENSQDPA